jgi:hypothetical protein
MMKNIGLELPKELVIQIVQLYFDIIQYEIFIPESITPIHLHENYFQFLPSCLGRNVTRKFEYNIYEDNYFMPLLSNNNEEERQTYSGLMKGLVHSRNLLKCSVATNIGEKLYWKGNLNTNNMDDAYGIWLFDFSKVGGLRNINYLKLQYTFHSTTPNWYIGVLSNTNEELNNLTRWCFLLPEVHTGRRIQSGNVEFGQKMNQLMDEYDRRCKNKNRYDKLLVKFTLSNGLEQVFHEVVSNGKCHYSQFTLSFNLP